MLSSNCPNIVKTFSIPRPSTRDFFVHTTKKTALGIALRAVSFSALMPKPISVSKPFVWTSSFSVLLRLSPLHHRIRADRGRDCRENGDDGLDDDLPDVLFHNTTFLGP